MSHRPSSVLSLLLTALLCACHGGVGTPAGSGTGMPSPASAPNRDDAIPAWAPGVAYQVGDLVSYDGEIYRCLQAHTSQSDWTPPATPALWQDTGMTVGGGGPPDAGAPAPDASAAPDLSNGPSGATEYAPYFYTWGWGDDSDYQFGTLVDMKAQSGLSAVTLAFVIAGPGGAPCTPTTDGNSDALEGAMQADIQAFQSGGGHVKVSFGGAQGLPLESDAACASATDLYQALAGFVSRTGLTDLDFDVEQSGVLTAALDQKRAQALAQLQAQYPAVQVSFTLPAVPRDKYGNPGGVLPDALAVVQAAAAAGVRIRRVNLMTMDYGPYYSAGMAMGALAVSALTDAKAQLQGIYPGLGEPQLWQMLGATPMIGQNDVSTEVFSLSDAATLAGFAQGQGLGLISFWAIQRDQPCPYVSVAVCSEVNTAPFQFHGVFKSLP